MDKGSRPFKLLRGGGGGFFQINFFLGSQGNKIPAAIGAGKEGYPAPFTILAKEKLYEVK